MVRLILLSLFLLVAGLPRAVASPRTDSLLAELNQVLRQRPRYEGQRQQRLTALKAAYRASAGDPAAQFSLGLRIYDEYKAYKYDSAFAYSRHLQQLAGQLGQPEKVAVAQLKLAFILLSSGMFTETLAELARLDARQLSPADRLDYYLVLARTYSDLGTFDQDDYYRPAHYAQALAYADTAARLCPAGAASYQCLAVQGFLAQKHRDLAAGIRYYRAVRALPQLTLPQIAVSASTLANIYELHGQSEAAFELLLVAAIADVRSATKETLAMFKVAEYCYRRGDLANAYTFIREARAEAAFYKARQRQVELSHVSFVVEGQKISIIEQQRQQLRRSTWGLAVLAAFGLACALVIGGQLRRLQRAERRVQAANQELQAANQQVRASNEELQQANAQLHQLNLGLHEAHRVKDEYIGYYLSSNSQAVDRLEELKHALLKLLAARQYPELQKALDGLNIKRERAALFHSFDRIFLQLFPGFVAAFNGLFRPEDQVTPPGDQLLTTELRIFALVRLGIADSERIGRILGYSVNTIYTYKTRVKNRSLVPNDEFEARVRALAAAEAPGRGATEADA